MDQTLLERIAGGDAAAVDECIARYGALIWSLARRHLRQHADAEDAVQDIYIEVWRNAARFDPGIASEGTFIAMLARRRLVDRHRKLSRTIPTQTLVEETPSDSPTHEARVDADEMADRARKFLATLRPDERRVLEMVLLEDRTQSDIAQVAGMPLGTVKTHARRGLAKLRAMFREDPNSQSLEGQA